MKILLSPTAFKGTLSPVRAANIIKSVIQKKIPSSKIVSLPLADGGDGTLEVLLNHLDGRWVTSRVRGPLGKKVRARWALLRNKTAVIEMARASGLALTRGKNKIMEASSFGTGQLIRAALDKKCRTILVGVGGAATAEGGAGALEALGLRFYDSKGRGLKPNPSSLQNLFRIDWSGFDPRIARTRLLVLCDVNNPLLGLRGSARVYGPQKGATPKQVKHIEKSLRHWSKFARIQNKNTPGVGAAGALAFGLSGFAGARLVRGTPFILNALQWKEAAREADLIVTGEGKVDKTSFSGKVIGEILKRKGRARVVVVCGTCGLSKPALKRRGVYTMAECGPEGLRRPVAALKKATLRLFN